MAAGKYSFTIEQGTTHEFEVQWKDSNGVPVNLTGYVGKMQIRASKGGTNYISLSSSLSGVQSETSNTAFLNLSGSNGTTPLSSGSIGVYIGHEKTDNFSFDEAVYDIELTNNQHRHRILEGKVKLSKQVTQI